MLALVHGHAEILSVKNGEDANRLATIQQTLLLTLSLTLCKLDS
jgi:hypothetical protein